jgi:hypothetical protein
MSAEFVNGELRYVVNGTQVIHSVFVDDAEGEFIAAQWRQIARVHRVTESFDGAKLVKKLLNLRTTDNAALRSQLLHLDQEILQLDGQIATAESEINEIIYRLYKLTSAERTVIAREKTD